MSGGAIILVNKMELPNEAGRVYHLSQHSKLPQNFNQSSKQQSFPLLVGLLCQQDSAVSAGLLRAVPARASPLMAAGAMSKAIGSGPWGFPCGMVAGSKRKNLKRTRWDLYHFSSVLIYFARWHTGLPDLSHFLQGYLRRRIASLLHKPVQVRGMGRTPSPASCGERCRAHSRRSMRYGRSCCGHCGKMQAATVCTPIPSSGVKRIPR